jgi:shikimate dehydrogenase
VAKPSRFAVVGHPISHSRSPEIHQAFARQFGLDIVYQRLDASPQRFKVCVDDFFAGGGVGLNVTVPHKASAYSLCQSVSARAASAGVINTLWQERGVMHGDNTDGVGLLHDLQRVASEHGRSLTGARVLVLGAGGAARGALVGLLDQQLSAIVIAARDAKQAEALGAQFSRHSNIAASGLDALHSSAFDIVINATSAGLSNSIPEMNDEWFDGCWLGYDLSYGASGTDHTAFLRHARSCGVPITLDGLGMLVEQAAEAFLLWHGLRPDAGAVLNQLRGLA